MQAHSLRAAEAQRVHVVKVVVEQVTQRAALLLADSSCLLVSLASPSAVPLSVPSPCTDACFLRLQAYGPAGAPSKPASASPSPSRVTFGGAIAGGGKQAEWTSSTLRIGGGEPSRAQELGEKASSKLSSGSDKATGQGLAAGTILRREFYAVTARPGKGGSCTDLRAWFCAGPAFVRADIELESGRRRIRASDRTHELQSGRVFARLDAPHGFAVRMAASINVLVVYSSAAGKFWVMAGKWLEQKGVSTQSPRSTGVSEAVESKRESSELRTEEGQRKGLLLMKCAVVGCNGPVYSLHVSTLHLFLGEKNGVQVWSLRALIKQGSSGRETGQAKSKTQGTTEKSSRLASGKPDSETPELGKLFQYCMEANSASGKVSEKKSVGNGIHPEGRSGASFMQDTIQIAKVEENSGGPVMKKEPWNGVYSTREPNVGTTMAGLNKNLKSKVDPDARLRNGEFAFRSLSELQAALAHGSGVQGGVPAANDKAGEKILQDGGGVVIKNETQNGIIRSHSADHGAYTKVDTPSATDPSVHSQGDGENSSSFDAFHSDKINGRSPVFKAVPWQRNGLISAKVSQLKIQDVAFHPRNHKNSHQTAAPVQTTGSCVQSRLPGPLFMALCRGTEGVVTSQSSSTAISRPPTQLQVVDIQGLSLKEYVLLDSKGELHLLTLQELLKEQEPENPNRTSLTIRQLQGSMRVSSFAVLPLPLPLPQPQQLIIPPAATTVKRKLWVSDGMYSVHVVSIPDEKSMAKNDSAVKASTLAVSQAVFTKEHVEGIVAGSPDTVMVLMKGKVVAYVMAGS